MDEDNSEAGVLYEDEAVEVVETDETRPPEDGQLIYPAMVGSLTHDLLALSFSQSCVRIWRSWR